jgi:nucleoside transporter
MPPNLRLRLSAMMFLQYAIGGSLPTAFIYWKSIDLSTSNISDLATLGILIGLVSPFVGGQIVDRWVPTQYFLAFSHCVGGVFLVLTGLQRDLVTIFVLSGGYALLSAPTMALTNSLAFHHLKDPDRQFGGIRVWGTIGWIVAGIGLTFWRHLCDPDFLAELGGFRFSLPWFETLWGLWWKNSEACLLGDLFFLAGGCSFAMGLLCLFLPHTPPARKGVNPLAFLEAFKLLKDRNFAIFLGIAFVATTEFQFYYLPVSQFLKEIGISQANVPLVMLVSQFAEIFILAFLLPPAVKRLGLRWTLALGVMAWSLRYVIFVIGQPTWLVAASLAFHGFGFAFFFVAAQIYVNNAAHSDIRASAQSLLGVVLGLGGLLGTQIFKGIAALFTTRGEGGQEITNWTYLFLVPCALTAACAVAYLLFFKSPEKQPAAEGAPA